MNDPQDNTFMQQALQLAMGGLGEVEPNPMVGCVIVRDGRVIGEGYHPYFGGPHAEIEAIMNALDCDEPTARNAGGRLAGATAYVTLEPCSHTGKTPPCTEALIAAGVSRVVAAIQDPDPNVAGNGFAKLRDAGIDVTVGCEEQAARELLRAYIKLRTQSRPWVILKWAQTAEGFWNRSPGAGGAISGPESGEIVQQLRAACDGIAVGVGTVLADNPLLTNRAGFGLMPTRIVLDPQLKTPTASRLVQTAEEAPLLIATTSEAMGSPKAASLKNAGIELLALPTAGKDRLDLAALLDELGQRHFTRLLVEGGPTVARSLLTGGLADEIFIFRSPESLNPSPETAEQLARLDVADIPDVYRLTREQTSGKDALLTYRKTAQE